MPVVGFQPTWRVSFDTSAPVASWSPLRGGWRSMIAGLPMIRSSLRKHFQHRDQFAAAEVERLARHGLRRLHGGIHAIGDVRVAANLQAVAGQLDRLALSGSRR